MSIQDNDQEEQVSNQDNNQGNAGDSQPVLNCDVLEQTVKVLLLYCLYFKD